MSNVQEFEQVFQQIFRKTLSEQSLVFNQVSSYEDFVENGLPNIITNMFRISTLIKITPSKETGYPKARDSGREIKSSYAEMRFSNAQIINPMPSDEAFRTLSTKGRVGKTDDDRIQCESQETQIPQEARLFGKSLKMDIIADIHLKLQSKSEEYGRGDVIEEVEFKRERVPISQIPLMVGSKYCVSSNKRTSQNKRTIEEHIAMQEDPLDLGGYFILKGNEWSTDFVESFKFNEPQLRNEHKLKMVRGFVISKNGDTYEPSFETDVRYRYQDGQITINISKIHETEVPFYIIFRMFGVNNEIEMMEMITQDDMSSTHPDTVFLLGVIQQACDASYPNFQNAKQCRSTDEALQCVADVLNTLEIKSRDKDLAYYDTKKVIDSYMSHLLPHMGVMSSNNIVKMRFLGDQIRKTLLAYKTNTFPDRHTYLEKRIHATGQNLAKKFKKLFNHHVISNVRIRIMNDVAQQGSVHKFNFEQILVLIQNNANNKQMQKAIVSGQTSQSGKPNEQAGKNKIQSQKINRKNIVNSVSTMRMITNSKLSRDKQSSKIIEQRAVHPSFAGFICPVQSSDNGDKAGKVKSLTSLSRITNNMDSEDVINAIFDVAGEYIYDISSIQSRDVMNRYRLRKLFVNGRWIAYVQSSKTALVAETLRRFRRENTAQWAELTIYWDKETMDLSVYSDYGRILNPMILVHYDEDGAPFTMLTPENTEYILSGKCNIEWLLEKQIIEYVSVEEAHNCLFAENPAVFIEQTRPEVIGSEKLRKRFTHIMIPQSLVGIVALLSPYGNHAQTKRITMFTNQAKQACGWATYNFPFRMDKGLMIQQYCSQPLVRTVMHDFFPPNCQQVVVAYMVYDGFNQEDSVIFNKGSVDLGMFNGYYYNYEETSLDSQESVCDDLTATQPLKVHGNFMKLVNGYIPINTWVVKGDALVAKRSSDNMVAGLLYSSDEPGFVEDIIRFQDENSHIIIRVKVKIVRNLKQGDKLASGQGCKGVISKLLTPSEMPFTEDGLIPDIIFNPHSIPTRLLTGQLIEAGFQRLAVDLCEFVDATMFTDTSISDLKDLYEKHGIKELGQTVMYNGQTGEKMTAKVFVAPTNYQRLQKFSITAKYVVRDGKVDTVTRQLVQNRSMGGGQRCGELEVVSLFAAGTAHTLSEKTFGSSDGHVLVVCETCGQLAEYNNDRDPQYRVYNCNTCKGNAKLAKVNSAWSYNLFSKTLEGTNIGISVELEPPVMEQMQGQGKK